MSLAGVRLKGTAVMSGPDPDIDGNRREVAQGNDRVGPGHEAGEVSLPMRRVRGR